MNVLWITGEELKIVSGAQKVIGGWLEQTSECLLQSENINFFAAGGSENVYFHKEVSDGVFYSYRKDQQTELVHRFCDIYEDCKPDVIHIWGSEYPHTFSAVQAAKKSDLLDKVVVSMQGLVSVCSHHYCGGVPCSVVKHHSFKELFRPNLLGKQKEMAQRGEYEKEALQLAKHCIGRTDWDLACVKQMNPEIHYHHCNETLREAFYGPTWSYKKCIPHTIFFSQAYYPIKGLHIMLQAMGIIKKFYPDVQLKVLGDDVAQKKWYRKGSFDQYLIKLIQENQLENHVQWLGRRTAEQMVEQYLNANVFVCSSMIENSSNSIGEAMLLGVPVVASDVGGIKSLLTHEKEGILFDSSAPYMLADGVMRIFADSEYAVELGKAAQKRAKETHNAEKNLRDLLEIYQEIAQ